MNDHLPVEGPLPESALSALSWVNEKANRVEQLEDGLRKIVAWCGTDDYVGEVGKACQDVLDGKDPNL